MTYSALDISKYFIDCDKKDKTKVEDISLMKLLKLLYYAEGCSLALDNGSIFSEKIVAWGHGPAVIEVYDFFPNALDLNEVADKDYEFREIKGEDRLLLNKVYEMFGNPYTAWELREKTHMEQPWINASRDGTYFKDPEITRTSIETYFRNHYIKDAA